jgi:hypothetical protein
LTARSVGSSVLSAGDALTSSSHGFIAGSTMMSATVSETKRDRSTREREEAHQIRRVQSTRGWTVQPAWRSAASAE